MASQRQEEERPVVVPLGARDGFDGSLEIYNTPQREFDITSGELIITEVQGEALAGSFSFTAREMTEEYTRDPPEARVEGSFQARPAN